MSGNSCARIGHRALLHQPEFSRVMEFLFEKLGHHPHVYQKVSPQCLAYVLTGLDQGLLVQWTELLHRLELLLAKQSQHRLVV